METARTDHLAGFVAMMALATGPMLSPASAEDIRVPHAQGETVLAARPQKVAVFDLASLDILNALGVDAVAAVPKSADGPANFPDYMSIYGEDRFARAGTVFEPDEASLRALGPDLIIVGGRSRSKFAEMSALAPTIDLTPGGGDLVAETIANTRLLGRIFGAEDRAEAEIADFEAAVAEVRAKGAAAGTGLLIFAAGEGYNPQPPGSRFGAVYDLAGVASVMGAPEPSSGPRPEAGTPEAEAARVRQREIAAAALAAQPGWIFVIDRNAAFGEESTLPERFAADPGITATEAWAAQRVIYLDSRNWYLVGGGIQALKDSARTISSAFAAAGL